MMRRLLATTAIAGILATSAYAQDAANPAAPTQVTPAAPIDTGTTAVPADGEVVVAGSGYLESLSPEQHLASDLTDLPVYQNAASDSASIGDIQNFLVNADGSVAAALVDMSIAGETRRVAIPFDQITWSVDQDNEPRAMLNIGAEQLDQAPAFVEPEDQAGATGVDGTAGTGTPAPATGGVATTTTTAPVGAADETQAAAPVTGTQTATATTDGYVSEIGQDQFLADDLMNVAVRSEMSGSDDIGSISDLVLAANGRVEAAVIGVGGFLGIGEKDVAVPMDQLQVVRDGSNELAVMASMTRDQLENAPSFDATQNVAVAGQATTTTTETSGEIAATDPAQGETVAPGGSVAGGGTEMDRIQGETTTTGIAGVTDTNTRDGMTAVTDRAELTADNLIGTTVYGPDDGAVGDIGDIALSTEGGVEAVIVDVGGFLGIGAKPVAVSMENLDFMQDSGGSLYLYTQFTKEQLEAATEYDAETYADNRDAMQLRSQDDVAGGNTLTTAPQTGVAATGTPATGERVATPATGTADTTTTASTTGARDGMMAVTDRAELSADNLLGSSVYGPNDASVGDIGDIALSADGEVDAVIVDVGGFLGIGVKQVAVGMDNVEFMRDSAGSVHLYTQFTEDQLENAPEYDETTYVDNRDTMRLESGAATSQPVVITD